MNFLPLGFTRAHEPETPGGKQFRVNGTLHQPSCAREADRSETAGDRLVAYDCRDVQPGARRDRLYAAKGSVDRKIRATQEAGAERGQVPGSPPHQGGDTR